MGRANSVPPSDWPGMEMPDMKRLTDEIYYGWVDTDANPTFWHWCPTMAAVPEERTVHGPWVAASTSAHTLVSREPLHLEPSLLWDCCGTHGFVRDGKWVPA